MTGRFVPGSGINTGLFSCSLDCGNTVTMKFITAVLVLSPLVAATGSNLKRATVVPRQDGSMYKTDLFTGTNLKQQQSVLNNRFEPFVMKKIRRR